MAMLVESTKDWREHIGLVQKQAALALEIYETHLYNMESKEKLFLTARLNDLAAVFNISEDELLTLWSAEKIELVLKGKQLVNQVIVQATNLLIQTAP